ncbi:hypothetical protein [Streptomyces beihaiensis]|uniref:Uncharacterized protein n=1 Tax=Streptomyces beihaiensis TaxID=2984495 RepID=A0ABT3TW53_9ACTN|nr:hypothetical protein [Streptomyces beihaiensis]MCX3061279.1 hypothetical protein [Streptomyces beihaiensis]
MGLFDRLTGTRRPPEGVAARPAADVRAALLALNGPDVPYAVRDGRAEGADLIAEWRVLEPAWQTYFARSQVSRTFQVRMRLAPDQHEVRAVDQEFDVTWSAGAPTLSVVARAQRGQVRTVSVRRTVGGDGTGAGGTDSFRFDSDDLKRPLQETVLGSGWTWRGVILGKL